MGVEDKDFEHAIRVIYDAFVDSEDNVITIDELEAGKPGEDSVE